MILSEEFTILLKRGQKKAVFPFLRALDQEQKKELAPWVKELAKEYFDFAYDPSAGHWQAKATTTQREILQLAALATLSRKEYEKIDPGAWALGITGVEQVLSWHCPAWFNTFFNDLASQDYFPHFLHYNNILAWRAKGYIEPTPELIAKVFPQILIEYVDRDHQREFRPENLHAHAVTLEEHIWYLFRYESNIHWTDRYLGHTGPQELRWIDIFARLAEEGSLDRSRLLRETTAAMSHHFNKALTGWFTDLLVRLAPTVEELLTLQEVLLATAYASHSKPVNTMLKYIKQLATHDLFLLESFLEIAPVLLTSETKSIVTSTLMVLEKLAKRHPDRTPDMCILACQALMHYDDALQTRAARLIQRYGDPQCESLRETVAPYYVALFSTGRQLLHAFASEEEKAMPAPSPPKVVSATDASLAVPAVDTLDELVFLASQAFDNNDPMHFHQLPAALVHWTPRLRGETISLLAPAFQRAYQLMMQDWRSSLGFLDHMLANFFVDYGQLLVERFPEETTELQALHEKFVQQDRADYDQWSHYEYRIEGLDEWRTRHNDPIYRPFKSLLLSVLDTIRRGCSLPLLSTPTHAPYWVDPKTLVQRLQQYQQQGIAPAEADWQIALARTSLEDTRAAQKLAQALLEGEYQELVLFLLDPARSPQGPITQPARWMAAALTKQPTTARQQYEQFNWPIISGWYSTDVPSWQVTVKKAYHSLYDQQQRKYVKEEYQRKTLTLDPEAPASASRLKQVVTQLLSTKKDSILMVHQCLALKAPFLSAEHNDVARFFSLVPNYVEPLVSLVVGTSLNHATSSEVRDQRLVVSTLEALLARSRPWGPATHLLVATCMMNQDKTTRALAAELWIRGVNEGTVDSEYIGWIVGQHEKVEFAPLKRFTDLLTDHLLRLSDQHTNALAHLLTACMAELTEKPIRNLKKLLEIYREVMDGSEVPWGNEAVRSKLIAWRSVGSLKKTATALLEEEAVGIN